MANLDKESFGSSRYAELFRAVFRETMRKMLQSEDVVCMKCRRFVRIGEIPSECCRKLGFAVDPETVVVDDATGKVTQASPKTKEHS